MSALLNKRLLVIIALALSPVAVLAVFYWPFLTGREVFFFKDTCDFFEPLCTFIGKALATGRLPLWNPYSYCGMSQAAITSPAIFYPPNWLFACFSFSQALALIMILSQITCAAGMYLLCRSLSWHPLACAIAAISLSMCGYMFSLSTNYTLVATASWMPMVIFASRLVSKQPEPSWVCLNALSIFMLITAGRPEVGAPALVLAFLAACISGGPNSGLLRSFLIGGLLSMPVVLPAIEWLPWSRRAEGLATGEMLMYSADWYNILCLFVPEPLGNLQLRGSPYAAMVGAAIHPPYYASAFVGCALLVLAMIGMLRRGARAYKFALAALLLFFVVSLGSNLPLVDNWIAALPGASLVRFPDKLLIFVIFFLSLFAARGAHHYLHGYVRLRWHIVAWLLLTVLIAGLWSAPFVVLPFQSAAGALAAQQKIAECTLGQMLSAFCLLLVMKLLLRRRAAALLIVLTGLICTLTANAFINCVLPAPPDFFERPSTALNYLHLSGEKNIPRITNLTLSRLSLPPDIQAGDRLAATVNNFEYGRQMLRPLANVDFQVPSAYGFEGAMVGEYFHFFANAFFNSSQAATMFWQPRENSSVSKADDLLLYRLLQSTSTEYVVNQVYRLLPGGKTAVPQLDRQLFEPVVSSESQNLSLWRLRRTLPRAYLAASWHIFDKRADLLEYFVNCRSNQLDLSQETLVEAPQTLLQSLVDGDLRTVRTTPKTLAPVTAEDVDPEHIKIATGDADRRLLVLQDQYYPGWIARIDGKRTPILRVNGFMRGVLVPPGAHLVTFSFEPISVTAGLLLWCVGLIWMLALVIAGQRQRLKHN